MPFNPSDLSKYPSSAGVYLMKDKDEKVLYIGKAKNIKTRLKQYFLEKGDEREMVQYLIQKIENIDTILVPTERDALILENNLIKKHQPRYNVLLKDDKTYVSLILTKHEWPALKIIRGKKRPKNAKYYFGPYTNAKVARQTLDLISRIFPLRECSDTELINRTRPCLLYDIKRCIAPCTQKCTKKEYDEVVTSVKDLLLGKDKKILKDFKSKMKTASDHLEFEKAAEYHRMIQQIEHIMSVQHVDNSGAENCDVLHIYREADAIMLVKLIFREYKLIGSEHFSFHQILSSDEEVFETFLMQHYHSKDHHPQEILLPLSIPQKATLEAILQKNTKKKIHILIPKKGKKMDLLSIAHQNAKSLFQREQDARSLKEKMLLDLQETLLLNRFPRKIECFDTSNIQGTNAVAAMVVFINGEKDKNAQRYFKIKSEANDYAATKEVLLRHLTKAKEKNDFADLLVIDGGKGHLNIAIQVLDELNIANIDVIGVAKEKSLHTFGVTQEKVFIPHEKNPISINPHSPLLFLLQKIRDEAHRVAIGFHRKRRAKTTIQTSIDLIPGIGPKKRKLLLTHFKSLKKLKEASREELENLKGLSKKDIDNLLSFFDQQ